MDVQLPLSIVLSEVATFENYLQGENVVALGLCRQLSLGEGDKQVLLWGEKAVGKTHLLQAVCSQTVEGTRLASCIPLKEMLQYGPHILDGLDRLDLVCIDDIQQCAGQRDWEEALFSFINQCRVSKTQLLFSANNSPSELCIELPDLLSRLGWGAVVQIKELGDKDKLLWLQQRAQRQGLNMPEDVARYLLRHYPRDMHLQDKLLIDLNTASLAVQRRLTIAFIKEVLG